ncbi:MAG TPA: flagellar basal body-associated FliL family protein [Spirochaetia bacterium]|nr:flagellar basal body-associated FliL family protein [Spirochaetia bacterium]
MSDELFEAEEESVGGDQSGKKKVGFLPGIVIQILKWAAIILGAVIFIVTVVVVTVSILNSGNKAQSQAPLSAEYQATKPIYAYYSNIGEIRGRTADQVPHTVIVDPVLGFDPNNKALAAELGQRAPEIRDIVLSYFISKSASQLDGADNMQRVKDDLREEINRILAHGKIAEVFFKSYNVVEF